MPVMTTGIRSWLAVVACVAALAVAGCGKSGAGKYSDELETAGFQNVSVTRDEEGSGKRKKLVAYDFDVVVNTDGDDATCAVELEHPANSKGRLQGDQWHIDEVNGEDVNDWGTDSPDAAKVKQLLQEHGYDC
jgi:hypothetical protein